MAQNLLLTLLPPSSVHGLQPSPDISSTPAAVLQRLAGSPYIHTLCSVRTSPALRAPDPKQRQGVSHPMSLFSAGTGPWPWMSLYSTGSSVPLGSQSVRPTVPMLNRLPCFSLWAQGGALSEDTRTEPPAPLTTLCREHRVRTSTLNDTS